MPHRFRSILIACITIVFSAGLSLIGLELLFRFLPVSDNLIYVMCDEQNKYVRFSPNQTVNFSRGWNFKIINKVHVNNYGFVNDQDYCQMPTIPLIAVVGDSYVESLMVPYQKTIHGRLASFYHNSALIYSFGMSGSPLSQYLAYAEFAKNTFRPKGMIVTVVGNDFDESVRQLVKRPSFHQLVHQRTGFELELTQANKNYGLGLGLAPFFMKSALYRYLILNLNLPLNPILLLAMILDHVGYNDEKWVANVSAKKSEDIVAESKLAVDFFVNNLCRFAGLPRNRILILVDGIRPELYDSYCLEQASSSYFSLMRNYLMTQALDRGYHVIDMQPRFISSFATRGKRFEWDFDGHWNSLGHEEAANAVIEYGFIEKILSE